jgi:hypothetical protein
MLISAARPSETARRPTLRSRKCENRAAIGQGPVPSGGGLGERRLRTQAHQSSVDQERNPDLTDKDASSEALPDERRKIGAVLLLRLECPSGAGGGD